MQDQASRGQQLVRAAIASTVGTSIEWYDYFLYGAAAALVFPKLFFPTKDPLTGVLASFATYAVGFAARPVGAVIFGHFGDRIGRKATLIATLLLMGLATAAVGIVPGYASIGIWGGVLLTALRTIQGIGVGGEWGGSVLLSMEWGGVRRRGLVASWPHLGVPVGLILGYGALYEFGNIAGSGFLTWGWRIPFILSLVLLLIGLYIRLGITETPSFRRIVEQRRIEPQPVVEVVSRNWREIVLSMFVRMAEQAPFYVFTVFMLTYGVKVLGFTNNFMLLTVIIAACLSLLTIPVAAHLSDQFGRRLVTGIGVVMLAVFAFPYFALLNSKIVGLVVVGVIISLIPHDFQYGPQASLIAENFTGRLRYSGASIGYQLASVIAGGPAPLIAAALLAAFHSSVPIAIYLVFCAVVSMIALVLIPNRAHVDHNVEYDDAQAATPAGARPAEAT